MLEASPLKLNLHPSQKHYNVSLINQSATQTIAFKISTTQKNAFNIEPANGCLPQQARVSLLITTKNTEPLQEKIQISYAVAQSGCTSFSEAWSNIKKNKQQVSRITIRAATRTDYSEGQREEEKEQRENNRKKTIGSLQRLPTIEEDSEFKQMLNLTRANLPSPDLDKLMVYFKQQRERHFNEQQKEALCYELQQMGHRYIQQVNQSSRLKQQLEIVEGKLRDSHRQENRSGAVQFIKHYCEGHHVSFSALVLLAVTSFVLGFIFSKLV